MRKVGGGGIGFLEKPEQQRVGIARLAHLVVGQDELAEVFVVKGTGRAQGRVTVAGRFRIGVDIERRAAVAAVAGPEAAARYLV